MSARAATAGYPLLRARRRRRRARRLGGIIILVSLSIFVLSLPPRGRELASDGDVNDKQISTVDRRAQFVSTLSQMCPEVTKKKLQNHDGDVDEKQVEAVDKKAHFVSTLSQICPEVTKKPEKLQVLPTKSIQTPDSNSEPQSLSSTPSPSLAPLVIEISEDSHRRAIKTAAALATTTAIVTRWREISTLISKAVRKYRTFIGSYRTQPPTPQLLESIPPASQILETLNAQQAADGNATENVIRESEKITEALNAMSISKPTNITIEEPKRCEDPEELPGEEVKDGVVNEDDIGTPESAEVGIEKEEKVEENSLWGKPRDWRNRAEISPEEARNLTRRYLEIKASEEISRNLNASMRSELDRIENRLLPARKLRVMTSLAKNTKERIRRQELLNLTSNETLATEIYEFWIDELREQTYKDIEPTLRANNDKPNPIIEMSLKHWEEEDERRKVDFERFKNGTLRDHEREELENMVKQRIAEKKQYEKLGLKDRIRNVQERKKFEETYDHKSKTQVKKDKELEHLSGALEQEEEYEKFMQRYEQRKHNKSVNLRQAWPNPESTGSYYDYDNEHIDPMLKHYWKKYNAVRDGEETPETVFPTMQPTMQPTVTPTMHPTATVPGIYKYMSEEEVFERYAERSGLNKETIESRTVDKILNAEFEISMKSLQEQTKRDKLVEEKKEEEENLKIETKYENILSPEEEEKSIEMMMKADPYGRVNEESDETQEEEDEKDLEERIERSKQISEREREQDKREESLQDEWLRSLDGVIRKTKEQNQEKEAKSPSSKPYELSDEEHATFLGNPKSLESEISKSTIPDHDSAAEVYEETLPEHIDLSLQEEDRVRAKEMHNSGISSYESQRRKGKLRAQEMEEKESKMQEAAAALSRERFSQEMALAATVREKQLAEMEEKKKYDENKERFRLEGKDTNDEPSKLPKKPSHWGAGSESDLNISEDGVEHSGTKTPKHGGMESPGFLEDLSKLSLSPNLRGGDTDEEREILEEEADKLGERELQKRELEAEELLRKQMLQEREKKEESITETAKSAQFFEERAKASILRGGNIQINEAKVPKSAGLGLKGGGIEDHHAEKFAKLRQKMKELDIEEEAVPNSQSFNFEERNTFDTENALMDDLSPGIGFGDIAGRQAGTNNSVSNDTQKDIQSSPQELKPEASSDEEGGYYDTDREIEANAETLYEGHFAPSAYPYVVDDADKAWENLQKYLKTGKELKNIPKPTLQRAKYVEGFHLQMTEEPQIIVLMSIINRCLGNWKESLPKNKIINAFKIFCEGGEELIEKYLNAGFYWGVKQDENDKWVADTRYLVFLNDASSRKALQREAQRLSKFLRNYTRTISPTRRTLTVAQALEDIRLFENQLLTFSSYLNLILSEADLKKELDSLRKKVRSSENGKVLAAELTVRFGRFLNRIGDGNAQIDGHKESETFLALNGSVRSYASFGVLETDLGYAVIPSNAEVVASTVVPLGFQARENFLSAYVEKLHAIDPEPPASEEFFSARAAARILAPILNLTVHYQNYTKQKYGEEIPIKGDSLDRDKYLEENPGLEEVAWEVLCKHLNITNSSAPVHEIILHQVDALTNGTLLMYALYSGGLNDELATVKPNRNAGLIRKQFPLLLEIDGKNVSEWIKAASRTRFLSAGPRKRVRYSATQHLNRIAELRRLMGLPERNTVALTLQNPKTLQKGFALLELRNLDGMSSHFIPPDEHLSSNLSISPTHNIDYFRLGCLDFTTQIIHELSRAMQSAQFSQNEGLLIDLRWSEGISYGIFDLLLSHLNPPGNGPRVVLAAAARLMKGSKYEEDHPILRQDGFFTKDSPWISEKERKAIDKFEKTFKPRWGNLKSANFSKMHYKIAPARKKIQPSSDGGHKNMSEIPLKFDAMMNQGLNFISARHREKLYSALVQKFDEDKDGLLNHEEFVQLLDHALGNFSQFRIVEGEEDVEIIRANMTRFCKILRDPLRWGEILDILGCSRANSTLSPNGLLRLDLMMNDGLILRQSLFLKLLSHNLSEEIYHFSKPIVILVDGATRGTGCAITSALRAFKNVAVIGSQDSGSPSSIQVFDLPNLKQRFKFSTTVVFHRSGRIIEEAPSSPDIEIPLDIEDVACVQGEDTKGQRFEGSNKIVENPNEMFGHDSVLCRASALVRRMARGEDMSQRRREAAAAASFITSSRS